MQIVRNGSSRNGATPARRRYVRSPEQIAVSIERVEHLILEVSKTDGASSLLLNGLEERIAALEDAPVPGVTLRHHDARLNRVEEVLKANGAVHRAA